MKASELQDHIAGTYFSLRWGMVAMAFAFPVVITLGGSFLFKVGLMESLSQYYYTGVRDLFVGLLVAIGACLYLYKGFSTSENLALNLAGAFVVCVAMFPTSPPTCAGSCSLVTTHAVAAVLFFLCIAYVAIFKGPETLSLIGDERKRVKYRRTYKTLGTAMIVSPVVALIASRTLEGWTGKKFLVVFAEWLAVWIFATYWLFKSRELASTEAEKQALSSDLQTSSPPAAESGSRIRKVFSTKSVQRVT
jgi:hypothetical protein